MEGIVADVTRPQLALCERMRREYDEAGSQGDTKKLAPRDPATNEEATRKRLDFSLRERNVGHRELVHE